MDPQAAALQQFHTQSFFLLQGLPRGSEFGLDGLIWSVNSFSGVKLLPAGLHFFIFSAAPSSSASSTPESLSSGVGVRHGLLRFFSSSEQEIVSEEWDNKREELVSSSSGRRKRRRTLLPSAEIEEIPRVPSADQLKSLDPTLAPYPASLGSSWPPLVSFITPSTLARVVGVDKRGSALVDAVMGSVADEEELAAAEKRSGKQVWGKVRAEKKDEDEKHEDDGDDEEEEEEEQGLLRFVSVDTRRSWPSGSVGEELTRWSKDKSWALSHAVRSQLANDPKELLAELQLSFILFTLLHNFSSLTSYKSLITLLCRSSSLLLPMEHPSRPSTSPAAPSTEAELTLPLFASFLSILHAQLTFLDPAFFSDQMPSLDIFLLAELDALNSALSDAAPQWSSAGPDESSPVWAEVVRRWDGLTALGMEKFGWELGMIKGARRGGAQREEKIKSAGVYSDDEVDLEDLEEGEDAPVVVEM